MTTTPGHSSDAKRAHLGSLGLESLWVVHGEPLEASGPGLT